MPPRGSGCSAMTTERRSQRGPGRSAVNPAEFLIAADCGVCAAVDVHYPRTGGARVAAVAVVLYGRDDGAQKL